MNSRTNPFEALEQLFERMSRQFEDAARSWETGEMPTIWEAGFEPTAIDLAERDDEYVVTVDVPGFEKDEIDVRVSEGTIRIDAAHEEADEEREENYLRKERRERSLKRVLSLPEPVDEDAVKATVKNGILTITLPKLEPAEEAHEIEIDVE